MASVTELEARADEIRNELQDIDKDNTGGRLPEDVKERWNALNIELEELSATLVEVKARAARIDELRDLASRGSGEPEPKAVIRGGTRATRIPENVYDVHEYRRTTSSEEEYGQALRDGAMRAVESLTFAHPNADKAAVQGNIERLLDTIDDEHRTFARRVLVTGNPTYQRAFGKHVAGRNLSTEEQRALGLGSQGGNYPVPIVLDPTVTLTSNGQVNPMRQISRVIPIVGNVYEGVASTGITAAYSAEAIESTDNSPTLTQPSYNVEKAKAFVPFSIEAGEDWGALQSEMARLLQDAKDALESTKFVSGVGHGSQEPQGLLTGATAALSTAATTTFAVADLYSLLEGLPPRWQPNATFIANLKYLNKIRQFDTAGGASLWVQLGNGLPSRLLDLPTYQYSAYSTASTSGSSIVTVGDFSQYYIIERIGMEIELIPHLFGTVSNFPTGQRGLFAYWRNTAGVNTITAFKTLKLL